MRKFASEGHNLYIVCPLERKRRQKTELKKFGNTNILGVRTLNLTKTSYFEKLIGLQSLSLFFFIYIKKFFREVRFDLLMYSTPPITFNPIINYFRKKNIPTYLLLKDIFPQNAVDLNIVKTTSLIYKYYRRKEKILYRLSDYIGCMSEANVYYLLRQNPEIHPGKVEVCPNSIEISERELENESELRNKYKLPNDKLIFIYGGNLGKPQGIDFLLEILKANKSNDKIFFVISGDGTERYKIDGFIESEKPENVRVFKTLSEQSYLELVKASDCGLVFLDKRFTIPNFPSRILNYMELKKTIFLATDSNTDVGRICEQNGFGFWVLSGNLGDFNAKLKLIISKNEQLKQMGMLGYHYLIDNFSVDRTYNIIMAHFKDV